MTTKTPHKNAVELRAIADGTEVEYQHMADMGWSPVNSLRDFEVPDRRFRVKPHRWQREIDAQKAQKVVQCRNEGGKWFERTDEWNFDLAYSEFRIKPEVLRYRVARFFDEKTLNCTATADTEYFASCMEVAPNFVGWLTDWQEVEVPA